MSERINVGSLADLAVDSAKRIDVGQHRIALIRFADEVYAIGDECSHADYSLAEGILEADDCAVECPKHGALFDVKTGEPLTLPATQPVPTYAVELDGDDIFVVIT